MDAFEHESLEVYQLALEFIAQADKLTKMFTPARAFLADRLSQQAAAVAVDIAKGFSELAARDQLRFIRRARRAAIACAALLDVARSLRASDEGQLAAAREVLLRTVGLLATLNERLDEAVAAEGTE
jgi:23S rRNA-intervening sequence protein